MKNRSNIAASILLNPEMLENVYNSAIDSAGSADRELQKYLESIEGHIARFQTQLQELEFDFLDSDTVKTFIDLGTGALSVIDSIVDSLGMIGTLGTAAAIAAATRNFGGAKSCSHKIRRKSGFPYGYISFLMTKCEIHMGKTKRQYAGNCLHCYYSPTLMWTM